MAVLLCCSTRARISGHNSRGGGSDGRTHTHTLSLTLSLNTHTTHTHIHTHYLSLAQSLPVPSCRASASIDSTTIHTSTTRYNPGIVKAFIDSYCPTSTSLPAISCAAVAAVMVVVSA
jgi:hypothetical protein